MLDFLTHGARLRGAALGQFSLTKQLGDPIDFVWPCINSGDGDGVAFIKVTEAGLTLWDGPPFPVPVGQTTPLSLHQTIALSLGLHPLVAEMREGSPPDGTRLIESDTAALTVVSNPILTAVGKPQIFGLDGPTFFLIKKGTVIPYSWPCLNSGGGSGLARLRIVGQSINFLGTLITIPGLSTVVLLASFAALGIGGVTRTQTITMEDAAGVVLGSWTYSYTTTE